MKKICDVIFNDFYRSSLDDKEEKIDGGNNDDDSEHNSKEWKEAWIDE